MPQRKKPRIIHVVDALNRGGTELGILMLMKHGFYDGFDLHVIGLARGTGEVIEEMANVIGRERVSYLIDKHHISKIYYPLLLHGLHREFTNLSPQAAVFSMHNSQFLGRLAALSHRDLRTTSFEHFGKQRNLVGRLMLSLTSLRDSAVFGDTPETLRAISGHYMGVHSIHDVPLSIPEFGAPRPPRNPTPFRLLSFGRLHKQKNYLSLVQAVAQLNHEGRKLELTIAGEGEQRRHLQDLAHASGISDRIHLIGFKSDPAEKRILRNQSDIYIQPSLYEGSCLATIEAMAAGIPTIATRFAGIKDYGIDGKNMIAVKGYDAKDIANSLRHMMDNYIQIAGPMSADAIETIRRHFGEHNVKAKWTDAIGALSGTV